jgi:hypothetical protein
MAVLQLKLSQQKSLFGPKQTQVNFSNAMTKQNKKPVLWFEFGASHLQNRHFTAQATSPVHFLLYFGELFGLEL